MSQTPAADRNDYLRDIDLALAGFLARQFPQASKAQCEVAALVSRQLADGHLCLPVSDLAAESRKYGICQQPASELLERNPLLDDTGNKPLVLEQQRLYLNRYWQLETRIAAHLQARLQDTLLDGKTLAPVLDDLFPATAKTPPPDWQKIACALAGRKRIGIITGGPGTGKTTTVVKLLALLQQLALKENPQQPLRIRLAAPTGKAAARLTASIQHALDGFNTPGKGKADANLLDNLPREVVTLHRLLGTQKDSRHFRHNAGHPLMADLVVVDEASMIDIDILAQLLDALPPHCRLVLVGDKDQLASVEAGAVMSELCRAADVSHYDQDTLDFLADAGCAPALAAAPLSALAAQTARLQVNWRAKDAPGIAALAQAINRQDTAAAGQAWRDHAVNLARVDNRHGWIAEELIAGARGLKALLDTMRSQQPANSAAADAWAEKLLGQLGKQQLLTPLRRGPDGIEGLNLRITQALRRQHLIDATAHYAGRAVLVTQNLYELGLMNGDMGMLLEHPQLGLRVAFNKQGRIDWVLPEQLEGRSQDAWALSVHQSQGSEFERVLLHLPAVWSPLLSRELLYTAVTRASQQFVLLESDAAVFDQALQQQTRRHSGLGARLHGH